MKGWRTVAINAALAAVAVTDYFTSGAVIGQLVSDPRDAMAVVAAVNVVNIALRFITTTPVGQK